MPKNDPTQTSDAGSGFSAIAKAIEGLGELPPSYRMEEITEALTGLASEVGILARASAMSVIGQYGSAKDRAAAVKYLKDYFERGTFEE